MSDPTNPPTAASPDAQTLLPSLASVGDTEATRVKPDAPRLPRGALPLVPGYGVVRELARGGMGVVYLARDPAFDRDVAVKVMHPGQDAGRFVVESKVTAQLPHPGVPPVYALGTLDDGRPFLAMKLVEGRTLADELKASDRAADLPRLLGVFERVCETVGFAHSRGVVHRDLKPANVMVGAFGEALVMDWGLARTVGGADENLLAASRRRALAVDETLAGQVKGTPAFMAPEQARGEPVDARADVFALGGLLAVLLTGKAPFAADSVMHTIQKAAQAELGECFAHLDACAADEELVAVAKRCLAPEPADRYPDGAAVALALAEYRARVEERLRQAERDRAGAAVRAVEHRRQKRLQMLGIAVMAFVMTAVGGVHQWYERREDQRKADQLRADERAEADRKAAAALLDAERRFKAEQARQGVRSGIALAADLRAQFKFAPAGAALAQAADLANGGPPESRAEVERARKDLALAVKLDDIRYRKWRWVSRGGGKGAADPKSAAPHYRAALAEYGLDLATLDPATAAKRIATSDLKIELVAAVDDWALWESDAGLRDRLLEVARRADPNAWTDRLRDASIWTDRAVVTKLAAEVDPGAAPAAVCVLAELMQRHKLDLDPLLAAARAKHPTDFELSFTLAQWRARTRKDITVIGPYEAARALRPDNVTVWNNLANALRLAGDADGAVAAYREAVRLDPTFALTHSNLGNVLRDKRDVDGAIAAYRRALELDPKLALTHHSLAEVYTGQDRHAEALAHARAAVAADPQFARGHATLYKCLMRAGDLAGAAAALQEAVRLDPDEFRIRLRDLPPEVAPPPREVKR